MRHRHQREGWLLDAAAIYCDAVALAGRASAPRRGSAPAPCWPSGSTSAPTWPRPGSPAWPATPTTRKDALGQIRYCTRIRGDRVEVSRYTGEADYSAAVLGHLRALQAGRGQGLPDPLPDAAGDEPRRRPDRSNWWPGCSRTSSARWRSTAASTPRSSDEGIRRASSRTPVLPRLSGLHRPAPRRRAELLLSRGLRQLQGSPRRRHLRPGAGAQARLRSARRWSPTTSAWTAPSALPS